MDGQMIKDTLMNGDAALKKESLEREKGLRVGRKGE